MVREKLGLFVLKFAIRIHCVYILTKVDIYKIAGDFKNLDKKCFFVQTCPEKLGTIKDSFG